MLLRVEELLLKSSICGVKPTCQNRQNPWPSSTSYYSVSSLWSAMISQAFNVCFTALLNVIVFSSSLWKSGSLAIEWAEHWGATHNSVTPVLHNFWARVKSPPGGDLHQSWKVAAFFLTYCLHPTGGNITARWTTYELFTSCFLFLCLTTKEKYQKSGTKNWYQVYILKIKKKQLF